MNSISNYKKIHCLGIGGIGLSAIAEILQNNGHIVSGTDINETDVTRHLEDVGIKVIYEHKAENVDNVDAVVYSAAVSAEKPEMVRAKELGLPCFSRAEVLGMIMDHYKNSIAICGTHGKTTVTSMTSLILLKADYKPTILVGGNLEEINGNVEIGENEYFVTEACEYMDSFLQLRPSIGVVLNIDSDHLDYFKNINNIKKSFKQFVEQIPKDGIVIAFDGNPFVHDILQGMDNKLTYGYTESSDYYASDIQFDDNGYPEYDLYHKGDKITHVHLSVPGEHNVLNSMAAFVTAHYLGVDVDVITKTLRAYTGTHRRFDFTGYTSNGARIIDDYAHHPTEIKATLSAAQNVKHNELWCVFQPHTYTRTKALFDDFADSFTQVNHLILADIYAAREKDVYNVSSAKLEAAIEEKHPEMDVRYMANFEDIASHIEENVNKDDIVITMGAGDVYKIGEMLRVDESKGN